MNIFKFDDLVLESAELLFAERGVSILLGEGVIISRARYVSDDHPILYPLLEVDVLVQGDVGPEVHQLDDLVD
ncbi:hypothetical protein WM015_02405 [Bifidobacterium mongoliense]